MVSRSECSHPSVWVAVLLLLCSCLPELSLGVPHGKLPSRADLSPESLLSKPYSVGFEIEHKLLLDFAQSAEARARFVGRDFKEIAAAAKEEHDDEVKRSIEGERHLQTFLADREARKAGRELELSRRQRRANARVAELESRVAQLKARQAELEAQTANEVAAKAQAKAATSKKEHETIVKKELHALKMRKAKTTLALAAANAKVKALKTGTVPSAAAAAISKKSVIAGKPTSTKLSAKSAPTSSATGKAKSAVTSALKTATLAANKIASTAKKAVTAPVATSGNKKSLLQTSHSTESTAESTAEAEATAESESTAELLTTESPAIVVPDWPQLDDPHNVATEVRILNNGKPEVFKQPDATLAENLTKFAKHTGRQSYTEHFQQWPTATTTPAPAAQPEPVVTPTVATPAAPKITRVANPEPTPVAKKVSKFNLWIIVAIVSGVMFLCLIGAIIFLIRKKRKEGELEVGTGAEINQGYQTV